MSYYNIHYALDDTIVSEEGVFTNALTITVRADLNEESAAVELYAKAIAGYVIYSGEVFITDDTSTTMWRMALTEVGLDTAVWGDPLVLGEIDDTIGVTFFIECKAADTEDPHIDNSVLLYVEGLAEEVIV